MRTIYSLTFALLLFFSTTSSWALGIGSIEVHSKLGDKFNATVAISDTSNLNLEQIMASNAPAEVYQQLQVENAYIYQGLTFSIDSKTGKIYLHISSKEAIREPYLNFIVQIRWPNGQINKEFKVFIDP